MKMKIVLAGLLAASALYAEDAVVLKESVISTTGFETTLEENVKNISLITEEDLENKNFSSITEALSSVPGVTIYTNVFGTFVDLRGQGSGKAKSTVQIMVDGVNINPLDPAHGKMPLDSIPVENIASVEIIPGGGSVVYGDGTVGGVVNIRTKAQTGQVSNYVGTRFGSHGEKKVQVGAGHNFSDKLLIQVDATRAEKDGYRVGGDSSDAFVQGTVNYKINDKNSVGMKYSKSSQDNSSPVSLTKEQLDADRKQSGETDPWNAPSKSETERDSFSIDYRSKISENLEFVLDANYQNTENTWEMVMQTMTMSFVNGRPVISYVAQDSLGTFTDRKYSISPKLKFDYEGGELIAGMDYKDVKAKRMGEPGYLGLYLEFDSTFRKKSTGAFVLNKFTKGNFDFIQGIRGESTEFYSRRYTNLYSTSYPQPLPQNPVSRRIEDFSTEKSEKNSAYELSANYRYSDTGNVYLRGEGGFRTPAPSELTDKDQNLGYIENDLQSEKYNSIELGTKNMIGDIFASATLFYTETHDEIVQAGNMPTYWYFYNIGKTARKGIELSSEQYFGNLTLSQGFTAIDAKIKSDDRGTKGNYIPGVSKYSANISGTYQFTPAFTGTLALNYKNGYFINDSNTLGKVNEKVLTDLSLNYAFNDNLKIFGVINNIFDYDYYESVGTSTTSSDGKSYSPAAGRTYSAGFNYRF